MLQELKIAVYLLVARYFRFFARIRLRKWAPRVALITGSNGKTMALHLTEVQLGSAAKYSHHANSAYGICFDILGLKRKSFSPLEWIWLILAAPIAAWKGPYAEKIYIVEADGDRPGEGRFLGSLLRPEVCVWLSVARTHSMLFEKHFKKGGFKSIDETIAHEFGDFARCTSRLVIANTDNALIAQELRETKTDVYKIQENEQLENYTPSTSGTEFKIRGTTYRTPFLLPEETFYAISASVRIAEYFGMQPTSDLSALTMPAGRSSILQGIKHTTIVDSTYNANVDSVVAVVRMVEKISGEKWLVLGDLTEQGGFEKEEHERLANILAKTDAQRIIMVGPRMKKFVLPILRASKRDTVLESFIMPKDALAYLLSALQGNEILVFKGARFLEGIIEHLLLNTADVEKLCRRETIWQLRRKKWGL